MGARQHNALERNPNQLELVQVNQYQRRINASIERVWENVLDWEHLPWLHESSFDYVQLAEAGDWGWRTWSNPEQTASVELVVNKPRSEYVARSYQGEQQISEIWTRLQSVGSATDIEVTFELPDIASDQIPRLGKFFLDLYTRLWDEDETMMIEREAQLRRKHSEPAAKELVIQKPVQLPLTVQLDRNDWTLREVDGKVLVHSAVCPHLLGPINHDIPVIGHTVKCPWHGYQFDIVSGDCLGEANCKLKMPPTLSETPENFILKLT